MISFKELKERRAPVAVVGLGYVGLPLAVGLAKHVEVIGFDIQSERIAELKKGHDRTDEVEDVDLQMCQARFTCDPAELADAPVIIVAVPTPIDANRRPDLTPMFEASETVGKHMKKGAVVVYESTVYPGVTEEECVPLLEQYSGLTYKEDFTVGYSPERINPGDKINTLETIMKVVSGSDAETLGLLADVYGAVVTAGIHKASSIRVAEAAKVIENTQRDLNIALMNELAVIFDKMGIDTLEVLEAAGTKWNFLPFRPGLVGGHCIGVDPYYLTFKAEAIGYHPQVILAGRRINDGMGKFIAESCVKLLIKQNRLVQGARVGILGLTFKENVPDLRNTKVIDVVHELQEYGLEVLVHDPLADADEAQEEYGLSLAHLKDFEKLDAVIAAVPHDVYKGMLPEQMLNWFAEKESALLLDVRTMYDAEVLENSGITCWRL